MKYLSVRFCLFMLFSTLLAFPISTLRAQIPAFPGAEGGGMYTIGGRGGAVYYVNTLQDTVIGDKQTREGSLRWCLTRKEPKTILFKVAGIIHLTSDLVINSNTSLLGQSAPGDGICIADYAVKVKGENIIVRFMRFRLGDIYACQDDAFSGNKGKDVIIDHCSMSWSIDETASFYDNENFTMQWCIISESLRGSKHVKGYHGYGGIWGGKKASFHHNLLAHHDSRNPRMCGSRYSNQPELELVDFRNNVIYNWGSNSSYAGEGGSYNFVNNYYKPSRTSANSTRIFSPNGDDGSNNQPAGVWGKFYVSGNIIEGKWKVNEDNWLGIQPNPGEKSIKDLKSKKEFKLLPVTTHSAEQAYEKVMLVGGASYRRDATDARVIDETQKGLTPIRASAGVGTRAGLLDSQNDVGGWVAYSYNEQDVPVDLNNDGIPDTWLAQYYPDKSATDINSKGYTYLEVYLNSLVQHIVDAQYSVK